MISSSPAEKKDIIFKKKSLNGEYASPVWDSNNKNVIKKVESIHRKATRFIFNDYNRASSGSKIIRELNRILIL